MSIRVFYTSFLYRESTDILLKAAIDNIKDSDYSKILYIAPTPRKVRDCQKRFHGLTLLDNKHLTGLTGGCYIHPEMMTIKQFSKRLYSLYGEKKVIPRSLIPIIISRLSDRGMGFASIITNFINEIKQRHPDKDIKTIGKELKAIFHELGIPEEVSVRAMEALEIFDAYQELMNKNSAVDENDIMVACPGLIERHNYRPTILILDGFYELTGSEEAILKKLITNAKDTYISIPCDTTFLDITSNYINFLKHYFNIEEVYLYPEKEAIDLRHAQVYHPYPGIEEEVEGIARNIKNCFISGKIRDLEKITVTFPALYKYTDMVGRIFTRYGLPYTTSISKPAGRTRPFLDLIALLESVADDYPRLSFSECLISPYFKNVPSALKEWIPHICLRSGIIKGKDAWLNLSKAISNQQSAISNLMPDLEKELRWVFKKLAPLESIRDGGSYSQYCEVIIKLLNDLDFSDVSSKDIDLMEQVLEILKDLSFIDNLTIFNPHIATLTLRQFTDALKHILNATETETEGTGVQVMGFPEIRGIEPEYLYIGGLKDEDLPSKPDIDHILPDSVRTQFGLVNLKRYLLLQRFTFQRAIESTKNLHLSYPVMEGDRFFLPSPFLPWNRDVKHQVHGIFSKEEDLIRKGRTALASFITEIGGIEEKLKNKFGEDSYIRVTDIDSYRSCPRRFFIEKVLQLEPLEIKEYEVEARLLGTIAHEIMQALISKPFADLEDLRIRAEAIIDKLLSDKPVEDYWKKVIKDTFLSILPGIYELESKLADEGYSFMHAEVPVRGEVIKGIKLKGKVDRIDKKVPSSEFRVPSSKDNKLVTDVVELIDYKTGTTQFSGSQVMTKGATLQLFLYAALLEALGNKVERVGIYSLKDIKLSWIPGKIDKKNNRTIDDYIGSGLRFLKETVSKVRKGDFSASPLNEQTCRNCPERPYCPYVQKTVAGMLPSPLAGEG
ncbi:MAG: PD-(D/E)XK nuclease family protein [Nitrospirota bacterium]